MQICTSLRQIQSSFQRIYVAPANSMPRGFPGEFSSKLEVMKASVAKVEDACYATRLRSSEISDLGTVDTMLKERKRGQSDETSPTKDKRLGSHQGGQPDD